MSSDCASRIDQWQKDGFEERLVTTDRELRLATELGFNSIRVLVDYYVWKEEHDSFPDRFERYVQTAARHGIQLMVCFGNDCVVPKKKFERPVMGKQHYDLGYHGVRRKIPHRTLTEMGWSLLDEPESRKEFYAMMRKIIGKYARDPRILIWDIFNKPGNCGRGDVSGPRLREMFSRARELNPKAVFTGWTIDTHNDHAGVSELTRMELHRWEGTPELYYFEPGLGFQTSCFMPDVYVDINAVTEEKIAMLRCHANQKWR